jgi:probable F420-dependent oxidoreductase
MTSPRLKVRCGLGLGIRQVLASHTSFGSVIDAAEDLGLDSIWLSERVAGPSLDPLTALAFAAGRTRRLKLGTSVLVVPGRQPVPLAKQLATLDALSNGRLLPAVGLGTRDPREHEAFGVEPGERGSWFDEAIPLLRRLWSGETVTHHGDRFTVTDLQLFPKPVGPMPLWTGGKSPREYRRTGTLADGWLGSFQTPHEAGEARQAIIEAAESAGRSIDNDHYGMVVIYTRSELPEHFRVLVETQRPGLRASDLVPLGDEELDALLRAYVEVGISKFVLVPAQGPADWDTEIRALVDVTTPLEHQRT